EQLAELALAPYPVLESQLADRGHPVRHRRDRAFLLCRELARPLADFVDGTLCARAPEILRPGLEAIFAYEPAIGVVPCVLGDDYLIRPQRGEQRGGVRGGTAHHHTVACLEPVGHPDDVLASRWLRQSRLRLGEERDVFGQLLAPVPFVQALEAYAELLLLLRIEIEVLVSLPRRQGVEMAVAHLHHGAARSEDENDCQRQPRQVAAGCREVVQARKFHRQSRSLTQK